MRSRWARAALCLAAIFTETAGAETPSARFDLVKRNQLRADRARRVELAGTFARSRRARLQLSADHDFVFRTAVIDPRDHVILKFQQTFKGLPIHNTQLTVEQDESDRMEEPRGLVYPGIDINTKPSIPESELDRIVREALGLNGPARLSIAATLAIFPRVELRFEPDPSKRAHPDLPNAAEMRKVLMGMHLVWIADVSGRGFDAVRLYVDAHSGQVLDKEELTQTDSLFARTGTGRTRRYGVRSIPTAQWTPGGEFTLRDVTRGDSRVLNMNDEAPSDDNQGVNFISNDNDWGNGGIWQLGMSTTGSTGQTIATDVMFAIKNTWDMLLNVFGWHGRDDDGAPLIARVHYREASNPDQTYSDAKWDGTYANFGDGKAPAWASNSSINTVGHEFGHGVFGALGLSGSGETRAINEGHGDIMGSLVQHYALVGNGQGGELPTSPVDWRDRMENPLNYTADGLQGLQYYANGMAQVEEHRAGCAYGHAFVFLTQGSSTNVNSQLYSQLLPNGMPGIGVRKAADIWFLATTKYMPPAPTFTDVREAYEDAARELFGNLSVEHKAVRNAFGGINVGAVANDSAVPNASLGIPIVNESEGSVYVSGNATDDIGISRLEFAVDNLAQRTVNGKSSWFGYLDIGGKNPGSHSVKVTAADFASKQDTATRNFTLNGVNQLILDRGFENPGGKWTASSNGVFESNQTQSFLGSGFAELATGQWVRQIVEIPAAATNATFAYRLRVQQQFPINGQPPVPETLLVRIASENGQVLDTLATHSGFTDTEDVSSNDYKRFSFNVAEHKGKKIQVLFVAPFASPGRFRIDNVSLVYNAPVDANLSVAGDAGEDSVTFKLSHFEHGSPYSVKTVRYYVNNVLVGGSENEPFFELTVPANFPKSVNLQAKARAENHGGSQIGEFTDTFTIQPVNQLFDNPGFEEGTTRWSRSNGTIIGQNSGEAQYYRAFLGSRFARIGGAGTPGTNFLYQVVSLPGNAHNITLSYRVRVDSAALDAGDTLRVQVLDEQGDLLGTVDTLNGSRVTYRNENGLDNWRGYEKRTVNLTQYKGRIARIRWQGTEDQGNPTEFFLDNVSLTYTVLGVAN